MGNNLRVGIIGLRGFGNVHVKELSELQETSLIAVCDVDPELTKQIAQEYNTPHQFNDYRELVSSDEIDSVIICTPHFLHYEMAMAAINAGKHVFCEKPLAMNSKEATEMVSAADANNVILGCNYNQRLRPEMQKLKQAVGQGLLGDIYSIKSRWVVRTTQFWFNEHTGWRVEKDKAGGGILIGRGSHLIDAMMYLLNHPNIDRTFAHTSHALVGKEVDDYANVSMVTTNNCHISMEASYVQHLPEEDILEYTLAGTKGGASLISKNGKLTLKMGACDLQTGEWKDFNYKRDQANTTETTLSNFMNAIINKRVPLVTGEQAKQITEIIEKAYKSAEGT